MITLGRTLLTRNIGAPIGNPVELDVGHTVDIVQIINYSFYILGIQFVGMGAIEFPPRYKSDFRVSSLENMGIGGINLFTGHLIITPLLFQTAGISSSITYAFNPVSQPYSYVGINGFTNDELPYITSEPLTIFNQFHEFTDAQVSWHGIQNPTVTTNSQPGFCVVIDVIDLALFNTTSTDIDFVFTLTYTLQGTVVTRTWTYQLQGTTTTTGGLADHIVFYGEKIVSDINTAVSLGVVTSATIGSHNSTMGLQYHFEYPF